MNVRLRPARKRAFSLSPVLRGEGWGEGTNASTCEPRDIATRCPLTLPSPLSTGERVLSAARCTLDNLQYFQFDDQPWIKIDSLLKDARQSRFAQRNNPSFFDDQFIDYASAGEGGLADGGVFALRNAAADQKLPPFVGEDFGQAIAGRRAGVV